MDKIDSFFLGMTLGIIIVSAIVAFCIFNDSKYPTPLDVYRGKTTLEITYRDSVAIDSVVVFKNK